MHHVSPVGLKHLASGTPSPVGPFSSITLLLFCVQHRVPSVGNALFPCPRRSPSSPCLVVSWAAIRTSILSVDTLPRDSASQEGSSLGAAPCEPCTRWSLGSPCGGSLPTPWRTRGEWEWTLQCQQFSSAPWRASQPTPLTLRSLWSTGGCSRTPWVSLTGKR